MAGARNRMQFDVYRRSTGQYLGHVYADGPNRARNRYMQQLGIPGRSFPAEICDLDVKLHTSIEP